jgi:hypothetical protein
MDEPQTMPPCPDEDMPPSLIFLDSGNPSLGKDSHPGIYQCVDYRAPTLGEYFYSPGVDGVMRAEVEWGSPRVIVRKMQEMRGNAR